MVKLKETININKVLKKFNKMIKKNKLQSILIGISVFVLIIYLTNAISKKLNRVSEGMADPKDPMGECGKQSKRIIPSKKLEAFEEFRKELEKKHGSGIVHFNTKNKKITTNGKDKYTLKDYRVLSSYTTAAGPNADSQKRGECMHTGYLKNALSMGARLLDFEIFYDSRIQNIVVKSGKGPDSATGSYQNSTGTYNYLSGEDIFREIAKAFSMNGGSDGINNYSDPLIVLFRIKTRDKGVAACNKLKELTEMYLANKILPEKYGYNSERSYITKYSGNPTDNQVFDWATQIMEKRKNKNKKYKPSKLSERKKKFKWAEREIEKYYCRNAKKSARDIRKKNGLKVLNDDDISIMCKPKGNIYKNMVTLDNPVDGKYASFDQLCPDVCNEYFKPTHVLDEPIEKLMNKVIIAIDDPQKSYKDSGFFKYVNIAGSRLRVIKNGEVFNGDSSDIIKAPTKINMYISMPDYGLESNSDKSASKNVDFNIHFRNGIHGVMMKFNRMDNNFKKYYEYFYK